MTARQCTTHTLLALEERTAKTYTSSWLKVGSAIEGLLMVNVESESPTLDITVQVSPDAGTTAITHTTLDQIKAAGSVVSKLTQIGEWIRISAVVGVTMTFSVHLAIKT